MGLDWLSPFSLLTGVSVVIGYALLGATWLVWKTEGSAHDHPRRLSFSLGIATLVAMAAVSAATPFLRYDYWHRWFELPGLYLTAPVPLLVGAVVIIPVILGYTAWAYWVFRGKVGTQGYH